MLWFPVKLYQRPRQVFPKATPRPSHPCTTSPSAVLRSPSHASTIRSSIMLYYTTDFAPMFPEDWSIQRTGHPTCGRSNSTGLAACPFCSRQSMTTSTVAHWVRASMGSHHRPAGRRCIRHSNRRPFVSRSHSDGHNHPLTGYERSNAVFTTRSIATRV